MDYRDENIRVISAGDETFSATSRAKKREKKDDRIRSRIWELDFLRGLCVILMIFDHLMFDLGYIFGELWFEATGADIYMNIVNMATSYWGSTIRSIVRPLVVLCFFLICGISCSLSRSNFKRGGLLLAFSLILTGVTVAIDEPIIFGVLHMLSIAILVVALVRLATRGNKKAYAITAFTLGVILVIAEWILESVDVNVNNHLFMISEVFIDDSFVSLDYFPLLPNVGIVLIGASMGPILYPKRRTICSTLDTHFRWYRPFNFFGRHAAEFYLLHQVIWALLLGLFTIIAIPDGWNLIVNTFFVSA